MPDALETILYHLVGRDKPHVPGTPIAAPVPTQLDEKFETPADAARNLNAAFLIALCGPEHSLAARARGVLDRSLSIREWVGTARFFWNGLDRVRGEIRSRSVREPSFARRLEDLADWLSGTGTTGRERETEEKIWSVFFPEGTGIRGREERCIQELRQARRVRVLSPNAAPITDPGREVLFTANALLTVPPDGALDQGHHLSSALRRRLEPVMDEPQKTWYDHPVEIGTPPETNEILYGLKGLNEAMIFEKERGTMGREDRAVCILSVSVTHPGLHSVARDYIREEIGRFGGFPHLRLFAFTEADTRRLGQEVLGPAAARLLGETHPAAAFPDILGVDGEYGRHYTFLKAIAPFWQVLVDPAVRATFKIDLDQVFPQDALVAETGASALEHMRTPLWGAMGVDTFGDRVELGLLAGALVNDQDIHKGLFIPDVPFPRRPPDGDEILFFSPLPQALSTQAEMMTRYGVDDLDGQRACIQRIHVTGGTTGALVSTLMRHRPFTPSFVGRAEDQAFLLSCLAPSSSRPAYLHQPGLVMRHDKESFAMEAVRRARLSKRIGDDLRILLFSAYAAVVSDPVDPLKERLDPFTGCFISRIPESLVLLRSAVRAASFFSRSRREEGLQLVREGSRRIDKTLAFTQGAESPLKQVYERERRGWNVYFDVLAVLAEALGRGHGEALKLRGMARRIVRECALTP